jgi:hypothetical protein
LESRGTKSTSGRGSLGITRRSRRRGRTAGRTRVELGTKRGGDGSASFCCTSDGTSGMNGQGRGGCEEAVPVEVTSEDWKRGIKWDSWGIVGARVVERHFANAKMLNTVL